MEKKKWGKRRGKGEGELACGPLLIDGYFI
jgi:hypothetical protein